MGSTLQGAHLSGNTGSLPSSGVMSLSYGLWERLPDRHGRHSVFRRCILSKQAAQRRNGRPSAKSNPGW